MQMKTILKEWRRRLNEVVVDHPIEETYEKITDWAARVNMSGERLNIKTPAGVKPEEAIIAMFADLRPKVSQVDKEGAVTKITFDGVSVDVLAPYFNADWQSEEEVSTEEGSLISLSSFNPVGGKAIIRISGNLKDRKGNALLATIDPTTGKDELSAPLNEQEGEAAELKVEFDTYDIDVSGDEVTWYLKVNGHEIEVSTIRNFDPGDIAVQLAMDLEDDERFPGVDSDYEAQVDSIKRQIDTEEFQVSAKEAQAEADEQAASHFNYEGLKKDSPLLNIIREQVKKALRNPKKNSRVVLRERKCKWNNPDPADKQKIEKILKQKIDQRMAKYKDKTHAAAVLKLALDRFWNTEYGFPAEACAETGGRVAGARGGLEAIIIRAMQNYTEQLKKRVAAKGKGGGKGPVKSPAYKCKAQPKGRQEAEQMYGAYRKAQSGSREVIFDQYCIVSKKRETVQFENGVQLILKQK